MKIVPITFDSLFTNPVASCQRRLASMRSMAVNWIKMDPSLRWGDGFSLSKLCRVKSGRGLGASMLLAVPAFAGMTLVARASAETLVIKNGTVCTSVAGSACKAGVNIVVRDERIVAVGSNIAIPDGARVIDAQGKYVTPGLMDAYSRLGLQEIDAENSSDDGSASKAAFSAAFDSQWALNPEASGVAISRLGGVTRAAVLPSTTIGVFGGYGALVTTDPKNFLTRARAFQMVELGEDGASLAGGSRATSYVTFINALREAAQLGTTRRSSLLGQRDALTNRVDAEALASVANGDVPMVVHVERVADIKNILRLKNEFPKLRPIIVGATEGWMVARELAASRIPVVVQAFENLPASFEKLGATMANAARLKHAGVTVAVASFDSQQNVRLLYQYAGNLQALPGADALSESEALELITAAPAKVYGMDSIGTLEAGKLADIVVWDGPPLEVMSAPVQVMIAGRDMPMMSRQTLLRDRYKTLTGEQPFQYRK
jgi:imidazolonepropionase-like amidohydrolase